MYMVDFPHNGREVEGGYLSENCTVLSEGVWNGTKYTPLELAKGANKWRDNSVWNRHYEGKQRDESNRIGLLKNIHFDDNRIAGDIFLSNETPEGRESIELAKDGKVNGISVEHVDIEVDGVATNIEFLGVAIVPEPACRVCSLSQKEAKAMEDKEFKELKDTVTELAKGVKELAEANGGVKTEDFIKLNDTVGELSKGVVELGKTDVAALLKEQSNKSDKIITELEKRVKELEDIPEGNAGVSSDIDDSYAGITIDGKDGIHRMV